MAAPMCVARVLTSRQLWTFVRFQCSSKPLVRVEAVETSRDHEKKTIYQDGMGTKHGDVQGENFHFSERRREEFRLVDLRFLIPSSKCHGIIGERGNNIRRLKQDKTGIKNIKVYPKNCPGSSERVIAIVGQPGPIVNCIDTNFIVKLLTEITPLYVKYEPEFFNEDLVREYGGYNQSTGSEDYLRLMGGDIGGSRRSLLGGGDGDGIEDIRDFMKDSSMETDFGNTHPYTDEGTKPVIDSLLTPASEASESGLRPFAPMFKHRPPPVIGSFRFKPENMSMAERLDAFGRYLGSIELDRSVIEESLINACDTCVLDLHLQYNTKFIDVCGKGMVSGALFINSVFIVRDIGQNETLTKQEVYSKAIDILMNRTGMEILGIDDPGPAKLVQDIEDCNLLHSQDAKDMEAFKAFEPEHTGESLQEIEDCNLLHSQDAKDMEAFKAFEPEDTGPCEDPDILAGLDSLSKILTSKKYDNNRHNEISHVTRAIDKAMLYHQHQYIAKSHTMDNGRKYFLGKLMLGPLVIGQGKGYGKKTCKLDTFTKAFEHLTSGKSLKELIVSQPKESRLETGGMGNQGMRNVDEQQSTTATTTIQVTIRKEHAGYKGSFIEFIRVESGAHIVIGEDLESSDYRMITITGSEAQIKKAKSLLQMRTGCQLGVVDGDGLGDKMAFMEDNMGGMENQGMMNGNEQWCTTTTEVTIHVPKDMAGDIIDHKGSSIKNTRVESGAHIVIGEDLESSDYITITITGSEEQIKKAQSLLQTRLL